MLKKLSNQITVHWKPILIGSALSGVTSALTYMAADKFLHYVRNRYQNPNVNIIIVKPNNKYNQNK